MNPEKWDDIENNPTYLDMQEMVRTVEEVCQYCNAIGRNDLDAAKNLRRIAMFCSEPGLGKTHTVIRTARRMRVRFNRAGSISSASKSDMCVQFWNEVRHGSTLTIYDDEDLPYRSGPMISILKPAWQKPGEGIIRPPGTREIRNNEKWRLLDPEKYDPAVPPPSFEFLLGHVWLTNYAVHTETGRRSAKCHHDFRTLMDRGLRPMGIDSQPKNVAFYTIFLIMRGNLFRDLGMPIAAQVETTNFFMDQAFRLPYPNPRLALELARARTRPDHEERWKQIVRRALDAAPTQTPALTPDDFEGGKRPDIVAEIASAREREAATRRDREKDADIMRDRMATRAREREADRLAELERAHKLDEFHAEASRLRVIPDIRSERDPITVPYTVHPRRPEIRMAPSPYLPHDPDPEPAAEPAAADPAPARPEPDPVAAAPKSSAEPADPPADPDATAADPEAHSEPPEPPSTADVAPAAEPAATEPAPRHRASNDKPSAAVLRALNILHVEPRLWFGKGTIPSRVKSIVTAKGWVVITDKGGELTEAGHAILKAEVVDQDKSPLG